jgi:adenosine deaminase
MVDRGAPARPDVYDALPKVELHCHVEGTIRPSTVLELARAAGRSLPVEDPRDLYRYTSLDSFLAVFWLVQELLRTPDDWGRAAYESLVDAVPHGLRYREMFFTPARHLAAGQDLAGIVDGLTRGIATAESQTGVRAALIADMDRSYGPEVGRDFVERIVALRRAGGGERIIGIGMDSTELGVDLRAFAPAMALAKRNGLRVTAHAGEAVGVGAANIAIALDDLGAERIDHGIAIVEDQALVRRVADARIPITVCPNSNILIANRYARLEDHPFRAMREAGLLATVNTDDPAMTDLDLGREYRSVARAFGLAFDAMAAISLDGVEASWLDDADRRSLRADFVRQIDALRPGTDASDASGVSAS